MKSWIACVGIQVGMLILRALFFVFARAHRFAHWTRTRNREINHCAQMHETQYIVVYNVTLLEVLLAEARDISSIRKVVQKPTLDTSFSRRQVTIRFRRSSHWTGRSKHRKSTQRFDNDCCRFVAPCGFSMDVSRTVWRSREGSFFWSGTFFSVDLHTSKSVFEAHRAATRSVNAGGKLADNLRNLEAEEKNCLSNYESHFRHPFDTNSAKRA